MSLVADHSPAGVVDADGVRALRSSDRVPAALGALHRHRPVVLDADGRGYLAAAAADITTAEVSSLIRHGSGYVIAAAPASVLDRLGLPSATGPGTVRPTGVGPAAYTVSFDAHDGVGTGISGRDRARTLAVLADPGSRPEDLTRPGHVVAAVTDAHGVLGQPAAAEAAADLATLAGRGPVGVLCALLDPARGDQVDGTGAAEFAHRHDLARVSIDDLVRHRLCGDPPLTRGRDTAVPTAFGHFTATSYRDRRDQREHLALATPGTLPLPTNTATPVAILLDCPFGALGSQACSCASDRDTALSLIGPGGGVVLHLATPRGDVGRTPGTPAAGDGPASAIGPMAGTAAAVLADLARPRHIRDLSHPVESSPHTPGSVRIRLLRPATSCHVAVDALAALAGELRGLGVAIEDEVLLGRSTASTASDDVGLARHRTDPQGSESRG